MPLALILLVARSIDRIDSRLHSARALLLLLPAFCLLLARGAMRLSWQPPFSMRKVWPAAVGRWCQPSCSTWARRNDGTVLRCAWRCGRARGSAARTELVRNEVLGAQLSNQRVYARRRAAHMRLRRCRHDAGSTVYALLQATRCAAAVGKSRVNRAGRLSSSKLAALGCIVHARAPCPICRRCSWMSRTLGKFHAND